MPACVASHVIFDLKHNLESLFIAAIFLDKISRNGVGFRIVKIAVTEKILHELRNAG